MQKRYDLQRNFLCGLYQLIKYLDLDTKTIKNYISFIAPRMSVFLKLYFHFKICFEINNDLDVGEFIFTPTYKKHVTSLCVRLKAASWKHSGSVSTMRIYILIAKHFIKEHMNICDNPFP